jgi:hypothetical protein
MPDFCPSERRTPYGPDTVSTRSRKDLKAALMRMAFNGESRHSPTEMILLILWRLGASQPSPAHMQILDEINPYGFESAPRSVLMLDAMARQVEAELQESTGNAPPRKRYEYTPSRHLGSPMLQ